MPVVVTAWVTALEVDQELQCGLIGIAIQTLEHLCPMRLERVRAPASARDCVPVSARADHHSPQAGIVTPKSDTTDKCSQLTTVKAAGVLGTQFIEQLARIDVWPCIEPAAHQRPYQRKRVASIDVTSRKLPSLKFALPFSLRIQDWRGSPIKRGAGSCFYGYDFWSGWDSTLCRSGCVSLSDILHTSQVAGCRFRRVGRTHFS